MSDTPIELDSLPAGALTSALQSVPSDQLSQVLEMISDASYVQPRVIDQRR